MRAGSRKKIISENVLFSRKSHSAENEPTRLERAELYLNTLIRTILFLFLPKSYLILIHCRTIPYPNTWVEDPIGDPGSIPYLNTWRVLNCPRLIDALSYNSHFKHSNLLSMVFLVLTFAVPVIVTRASVIIHKIQLLIVFGAVVLDHLKSLGFILQWMHVYGVRFAGGGHKRHWAQYQHTCFGRIKHRKISTSSQDGTYWKGVPNLPPHQQEPSKAQGFELRKRQSSDNKNHCCTLCAEARIR